MVRTTTADDRTEHETPEAAADVYAHDPTADRFRDVVAAVRAEYDADGHDPTTSTVLSPVGLAARLAADAHGYDAASMIDFDRDDEVSVSYDSFDQDDPHATPIDLVRIAGHADETTDRTVRFRDGAGAVRLYVEVDRRDD